MKRINYHDLRNDFPHRKARAFFIESIFVKIDIIYG